MVIIISGLQGMRSILKSKPLRMPHIRLNTIIGRLCITDEIISGEYWHTSMPEGMSQSMYERYLAITLAVLAVDEM